MSKPVEMAAAETEWIELPHGKVRRDPDNAGYGRAVCYDCPEPREERYAVIPYGAASEAASGRCRSCGNKVSAAARDAEAVAAFKERVPETRQKLMPWRSVVHWPSVRRVWVPWKGVATGKAIRRGWCRSPAACAA